MNQWTSQTPFTQHVLILTLFSPPSFVKKSKEEVNVEKGKSYFGGRGAGGILMNFSVMYYIFLHTYSWTRRKNTKKGEKKLNIDTSQTHT